MQKFLPYYSLLSPIFIVGCILAFFAGVPKGIQNHPVVRYLVENSEVSSLLVIKNGEVIIDKNSNTPLPLASISKIVVAMVFAEEVVNGAINPEVSISLKDIERFYVDDENYQNWKSIGLEEGWIQKGEVALKYVARGCIRHSVSTNTDFLMEYLGLATINKWLREQGITKHEPIFPFNASGLVCHNLNQLPKKEFLAKMDTLSTEVYVQEVLSVQQMLALGQENPLLSKLYQQKINDKAFLKIWSDRFSKASANDYAKVMQRLSDKENMNDTLQQQISFLFEDWVFGENPGLDQQVRHISYKGGSTGFLLNSTLYIVDHQGNQAQVVLFMNELSPKQHKLLSKIFSSFVFDLAMSDDFAQSIRQALTAKNH